MFSLSLFSLLRSLATLSLRLVPSSSLYITVPSVSFQSILTYYCPTRLTNHSSPKYPKFISIISFIDIHKSAIFKYSLCSLKISQDLSSITLHIQCPVNFTVPIPNYIVQFLVLYTTTAFALLVYIYLLFLYLSFGPFYFI